MINLKHTIFPESINFVLEVDNQILPVCEWSNIEKTGSSRLIGWLQSDAERVHADANEIKVSHSIIADIPNNLAIDLGLPETLNTNMHIFHDGIISQPQFKLSYKWLRNSRGQEYPVSKREGCLLMISGKYHRIPFHLYKIAEAIDSINSSLSGSIHSKLLRLQEIENLLSPETYNSITKDGYLSSTKIFFASALELNVRQTSTGVDFDPVLLRSHKSQDPEQYEDVINFENVLIPEDRDKFINLFRKYSECQTNYSLGTGKYVVFDETLHKALSVVRRIQDSSPEKKLEFLKNPKAVLAEEGIPEDMLESILSDRIEGYGERLIKVIPWIKIEGQDWFPNENPPFGLKINGRELNLSSAECDKLADNIAQAIQAGEPFVEFNGEKIPATVESLNDLNQLSPIKPTNAKKLLDKSGLANRKSYVLYVKDNLSKIKYHRPRLEPRMHVSPFKEVPNNLKSSLATYPHQRDGIEWLVANYRAGVRGVLLADDMGLGKSFQALTFLAWLKEKIEAKEVIKRPALIVAPTGLLKNWEKEHKEHLYSPGLGELICAYGLNLKTIQDRSNKDLLVKPLDIQKLKEADWILTTYETLSNHQTSFAGVNYSAVIFDEMQKIKTPNAQITEAAQTIKADFFVGLTGTPIENRLADLWCLIDTLQPGRLGTLQEFSKQYERDDSTEASAQLKRELTESIDGIPPLMCRRMKDKTLKGLPKLNIERRVEDMPKIQAQAYKAVADEVNNSTRHGRHLDALHKFRSLLLHPDEYCLTVTDNNFIQESARLKATFKILDEIYEKREKALIFIESRKWHQVDFLPSIIRRRYGLSRDPMSITGAVNVKDRQDRVNLFQSEDNVFDVMLLSPKAAGVGLTLTKANHVIHLSRWWNPAVEDQCTDRAYRIGQTKEVNVYYPMTRHPELGEEGSFDFNLDKLLERKRKLSRELLVPSLTGDDLRELCIKSTASNTKIHLSSHAKTLEDINCLEWTQFEDWVVRKCKEAEFIVNKPNSQRDGGADIIIKNLRDEIVAIIQCKHSSRDAIPFTIIDDLFRARDAYSALQAKLFAVTNAENFNSAAQLMAKGHKSLVLISAENLLDVGNIIKNNITKM
jgi:SNF2 family DNA or RNA helicase